ncbi:MAG: glycosyltransferase [Candidatus Aenigmarchaeota archaeon]|nr:glycosyltransferase [Candidatus Aenigmarchaeota archaeon]
MDASVIVPAYNSERVIALCIEALQRQSFSGDYEIIVVDDGSTDGTADAVRKQGNVRLVEIRHAGPAAARNAGAKAAGGAILVFTDADCIPEGNWLGEMLKPFTDKGVAGVQGRYKSGQRELVARFVQLEIEERYARMRSRDRIDFIGSYSAAYRKGIFLEFGGFDESFSTASGEDPELSFKISKAGHRLVFNEAAVVGHMHPDSLGKYLRQKFRRAYWRVLLYKKHPDKIARDSYTPEWIKVQLICLGLLFLILAASYASFGYFYSLVLAVAGILSISGFEAERYMRKNFTIGLASVPIIILRDAVFCTGLLGGTLRLLR